MACLRIKKDLAAALVAFGVGIFAGADSAHALDAEVTDIRVGAHGLSTRLVIDLDRPIKASVFTLAGPARLVIDLPEVGWRLPPKPLPSNVGVLSRLRYGLFEPGNSRIVVDLNQPSRVHEAIALPAEGDQPHRLVIDMARATGHDFLRSVSAPPMEIIGNETTIAALRPKLSVSPPPKAEPAVAKEVPVVAPKPAAPPAPKAPAVRAVSAPPNPAMNQQLASLRLPRKPAVPDYGRKRVIVIDPGHGGVDPGAIGYSGSYEKHITLAAARDIKEYLEGTGRFSVYLTRDRDVFIRLRDRFEIAREKDADLFISVHADTIRNKKIRGLSVYTLSERASDKEAAELAERENKADLIAGVDLTHESAEVTNILIDLAQRETMNRSAQLASLFVQKLGSQVRVLRNPHRFAGFAVLKAPDVPSLLVELGFLSNRDDERALKSKSHRRNIATAIAEAVDSYFEQSEQASRL